eukprot:3050454-Pyramimonas_sp.AAC.1
MSSNSLRYDKGFAPFAKRWAQNLGPTASVPLGPGPRHSLSLLVAITLDPEVLLQEPPLLPGDMLQESICRSDMMRRWSPMV